MELTTIRCNTCGTKLAMNYVRYRDTNGSPYCHTCYTRLLSYANVTSELP
jgi:NAD-dependent SIR2 family protein deacetylase